MPEEQSEILDEVIELTVKVAVMQAPDYVVKALGRWCKELNDENEES
jgi:hypothetical protein